MTEVVIQMASGSYSGWETVSVERSVEQAAGTFTVDVTNKVPSLFAQALSIPMGGACTILADGQLVLTGWVEKVNRHIDANSSKITVSGSSKTIDIVDCSSIHPSGQFKQLNAAQIATQLVGDMGLSVLPQMNLSVIPNYRIEDGETIFESVVRACHRDGALLTDDEMGNLVLTEGGLGGFQGSLIEGIHFETGESEFNYEQVFSEYRVKGQSTLVDETWARAAVDLLGFATSSAPGRVRRSITHDHTDTDRATVRKRALWEAQRRSGKVTSCSIGVPSWLSETGTVWKPNSLVYVNSPTLGLEQMMMIVSASLSIDNGSGTQASLSLQPPSAFKASASDTGSRSSTSGTSQSKASPVASIPVIQSGGSTQFPDPLNTVFRQDVTTTPSGTP